MPITPRLTALLLALAPPLVLTPAVRAIHAQTARPSPRDETTLPLDSATLAARVDSVFAPWRGPDRPGCAVGVSHRGRPVLERAYGMADLESGTRMTPTT